MIISTSISNNLGVPLSFVYVRTCASALLLAVATTACAAPPPETGNAQAAQKTTPAPSVKTILSASFEKAVLDKGATSVTENRMPDSNSIGMTCNPNRLTSGKAQLTITLPQALTARQHAFAVITPTGQLYEIYSPYTPDVEQADIIIPSDIISWQKARTRNIFTFAAADLMATGLGKTVPAQVFQEAGLYKFALVSSIQKDLIAVSDTPGQVRVFAGCLVEWVL
jgi:hypothetical protein